MSSAENMPEASTASPATARPIAADEVKAHWPLAMSLGVASLLLMFVLLVGIMYYFTRSFEPGKPNPDETSPQKKLAELIRSNDEELNGYGWVDRKKKIVRVPIDRAMELVVDEAERSGPKSQEQGKK